MKVEIVCFLVMFVAFRQSAKISIQFLSRNHINGKVILTTQQNNVRIKKSDSCVCVFFQC